MYILLAIFVNDRIKINDTHTHTCFQANTYIRFKIRWHTHTHTQLAFEYCVVQNIHSPEGQARTYTSYSYFLNAHFKPLPIL